MVIHPWSHHGEGVVLVCQGEQRFTLNVGVGDVDAVEDGREVIHYAKEVIVVPEDVLVLLRWRGERRVRSGRWVVVASGGV